MTGVAEQEVGPGLSSPGPIKYHHLYIDPVSERPLIYLSIRFLSCPIPTMLPRASLTHGLVASLLGSPAPAASAVGSEASGSRMGGFLPPLECLPLSPSRCNDLPGYPRSDAPLLCWQSGFWELWLHWVPECRRRQQQLSLALLSGSIWFGL